MVLFMTNCFIGTILYDDIAHINFSATATATTLSTFPAMSQEEVEEWLAHIPVYAVTDSNGSGVVLKPDADSNVFYFFMNPMMANQTLTTLKSANEDLDLRVSAFSLGKIWFRVLKNGDAAEVKLKKPGAADSEGESATSDVEYRLVPDTRDLLGARMLLTMDPKDNEAMQNGEVTEEVARQAIQKAMTEATKFNSTYNEVPVFMIQQMRMQKQPEEGSDEEAVTLLPMYFNLQNMVAIWQQFATQAAGAEGVEPNINLLDLFELVERMQEESEIDFRNVVLVPPAPAGSEAAVGEQTASTTGGGVQMPGATLGDV